MSRRSAFTLVEVLVALLILSTVMVAMVVARNHQVEQLQAALQRSRAAELANQELARVVSAAEETDAFASSTQSTAEGLVVRLTRTKAWFERLPVDVVTVEVYRADRLGDGPLVSRTLYRPPPDEKAAEDGP